MAAARARCRRARWPAILVGVACLACTAGPALPARLAGEPLVTVIPDGTELVEQTVVDDGQALGKPVHATVIRRLRPTDGSDPGTLVPTIRTLAADAGWLLMDRDGPAAIYGTRTLEGVDLELTVRVSGQDVVVVVTTT